MRIVHGDQVAEKIRIHQHRQGVFRHRTVAAGEPGTSGNFILEMVRTTDDFFSPRHKHNFDQFRYQLEGEFDFDRNGKMTPGTIGYFPEGTAYGPQSSSVNSLTALRPPNDSDSLSACSAGLAVTIASRRSPRRSGGSRGAARPGRSARR